MTAMVAAYGRLARDPETRETRTGKPMCTATMAVDVTRQEDGRGKDADPWWLRIDAFGRNAEILARHVKGEPLSVGGRLELSRYRGRDGADRESWQVVADSVVSSRAVRPKGGTRASGGGDKPSSGDHGTAPPGNGGEPPPRGEDEIPF